MTADDALWREALAHLPAGGTAAAAPGAVAFLARRDYEGRCGEAWLWWPDGQAPRVERRHYDGHQAADWAMLLVLGDEALEALATQGEAAIAPLVRRGEIRPFLLKHMDDLDEAGLGDFVETLGLVFPRH